MLLDVEAQRKQQQAQKQQSSTVSNATDTISSPVKPRTKKNGQTINGKRSRKEIGGEPAEVVGTPTIQVQPLVLLPQSILPQDLDDDEPDRL